MGGPAILLTLAAMVALAVASKCGHLEYRYKLNLALVEIELQSGEIRSGRARLETLAKDPSEKDFGLIVRNATAVLKAHPAQHKQA